MDTATPPYAPPTLSLLLAQSRILKAVAGGTVLHGTPEGLSCRLEVSPEAFRLALRDLLLGGQIFATVDRDGELLVGRERRVHELGPSDVAERRRPSSRQGDSDLPPAS